MNRWDVPLLLAVEAAIAAVFVWMFMAMFAGRAT